MMIKCKPVFSIIVAVIMLLSMLPMSVLAASEQEGISNSNSIVVQESELESVELEDAETTTSDAVEQKITVRKVDAEGRILEGVQLIDHGFTPSPSHSSFTPNMVVYAFLCIALIVLVIIKIVLVIRRAKADADWNF